MSELSGLTVDQAIAITGSTNHHGAVQPVGGVNEKIEGFHALCAARGLDGSHGVLMPRQNVEDLMLDPDIVADVAARRYDAMVRERLERYAKALVEAPGGDLAPTRALAQPPTTPLRAGVTRNPHGSGSTS